MEPGTDDGVALVQRLIVEVSVAVHFMVVALKACGFQWPSEGATAESLDPVSTRWAEELCRLISADWNQVTITERRNPSWLFLRSEAGLLAFRAEELCHVMRAMFDRDAAATFDGPTGRVLKRGELLNYIGHEHLEVCRLVLGGLDGERGTSPLALAVENRFVLVGQQHVIALAADTGRFLALQERSRIARRHAAEHSLLFEGACI